MIMEKKYKIGGMMCAGCVASVERALTVLPGVESVKVDLAEGVAIVIGDVADDAVVGAIENIGFDYLGTVD